MNCHSISWYGAQLDTNSTCDFRAERRAKGDPGVSLDDLVYVGTKIARQIDMDGFDKMLDTAEIAQQAIRDAEPLLKVSPSFVPVPISTRCVCETFLLIRTGSSAVSHRAVRGSAGGGAGAHGRGA